MTRDQVLNGLNSYITHACDDAGRKAYRAGLRRITRDRHDAETLLCAVALSSMTLEMLLGGFRAYSGHLSVQEHFERHPTGLHTTRTTGHASRHAPSV